MKDYLLLPFNLSILFIRFLFTPFSRWVLKVELESLNRWNSTLLKACNTKNAEIEKLELATRIHLNATENIQNVLSHHKFNHLILTKTNEPVVISYDFVDLSNMELYLNNICGNRVGRFKAHLGVSRNCQGRALDLLKKIGLGTPIENWDDFVYIYILESNEFRKYYATTILQFLMTFVKEHNKVSKNQKKHIIGWLSYTSKDDHPWLCAFYQREGFKVYMVEDEGVIIKSID